MGICALSYAAAFLDICSQLLLFIYIFRSHFEFVHLNAKKNIFCSVCINCTHDDASGLYFFVCAHCLRAEVIKNDS